METPSPFNRNQPNVPPDYSPDASIVRNKVRLVAPDPDNMLAQRAFPDMNRLSQHCRAAEATFATLGTGPNSYPDPALNPDLLYGEAIGSNGWPQVWLCTPGTAPADYVCDVARLITDIAADPTKGLSTLTVGQIFHSHWADAENAPPDKLVLTADRGNAVVLNAATVTAMIALGGEKYALFVGQVHSRLTGGV